MSDRKKIMILGAGDAQLNLIRMARELRYEIVVCDRRGGTEAERRADKYYYQDYTDRDAVLDIARNEKIDGVISNSEPAMLSVAYVAEQLGLMGNSVASVEILLSKSKFRILQDNIGIYAPKHCEYGDVEDALRSASKMEFPIIIKPSQCSGTRGTERVNHYQEDKIKTAFETCKKFSRNGLVELEEYVEMDGLLVNEADIFVLENEIFWDGWLWTARSLDNQMVPMTYIFPMDITDAVRDEMKHDVEQMIRLAKIRHGEFNVETYYTPARRLFIIEINPRQGGNHIPQLIKQHTGVDFTRLLVTTSVGDMSYYHFLKSYERQCNYVTLQIVFAKKRGRFLAIHIEPELEGYVQWIDQKVAIGDMVEKGKNAGDAIAYIDMQFNDYETQHKFTDKIEKYIYAVVEE